MKLLRYNVAMSLDGFIASPDGGYDWIPDTPEVDFPALFAQFEAFVMGRKTYEVMQAQGQGNPTAGQRLLVASTTLKQDNAALGVELVRTDIAGRVRALKGEVQKDIWLFGGGMLFRHLLDAGVVDRVETSTVPVLLGEGIPLVPPGARRRLRLLSSQATVSGLVQSVYAVDNGAGAA